jgi:hypothetical protein
MAIQDLREIRTVLVERSNVKTPHIFSYLVIRIKDTLYNRMDKIVGALIFVPIIEREVPVKHWLACCSKVPGNKSETGKCIWILL